ncbi:TPA: TRD@ protein-like [Bos taurus]|nr:TPA: TRD@ protein-like [Bos taurus]
MPLSNLLWVFLVSTFSGSGVAQKVIQDQPDIFTQIAEAVTMNCQYETSWSNYNIFWYKQPPSGEMIFLKRDGHYSVNFQRSLKSSSLTISTLQLEDSAKYFCALFELTVLKVIGEAEQNPQSLIRESPSAAEPQLRYTPLDPRQEMAHSNGRTSEVCRHATSILSQRQREHE